MRLGTTSLVALGGLALAGAATAAGIPCDPTGATVAPAVLFSTSAALKGAGVGVSGTKYWAPEAKRAEAGVSWSVNETVSILFNYERTSYGGRTIPRDEDNGVLTRLKLAF